MITTKQKAQNNPVFEPLILEMYRYVNRTQALTDIEMEVLRYAAARLNNKETAALPYDNIENHYRSIMAKLEVKNMKQAVAIAISKGLIE